VIKLDELGFKMKTVVTKLIFGKPYKFTVEEEVYASSEILEVINCYPSANESSGAFEIKFLQNISNEDRPLAVDPAAFRRYRDSFSFNFGSVDLRFYPGREGSGKIIANVAKPRTGVIGLIRRAWNMEFPTIFDNVVQIFHELILIPSVYLHSDLALIHAASVEKSGKALLFSGTGGVGKSSSILHFSKQEEFSFCSDDICVVSAKGEVFPNMAWPKIYAYNITDKYSKKLALNNRNLISRIHFNTRVFLGMSARRKVDPRLMYKKVLTNSAILAGILFLKRENVVRPKVAPISCSSASKMIIGIMETEYFVFHKLLEWENYNATSLGLPPLLTMEQVRSSWKQVLESFLETGSVEKLSIPLDNQFGDFSHLIQTRAEEI
jgi:hypothetical protein